MDLRSSKRLIGFIFTLLILSGFVCSARSSAEDVSVLFNASFDLMDDSNLPEGWYEEAYRSNPGYSDISIQRMNVLGTEKNVLQIQNYALNDARLAQTVQVHPESLYHISAQVMADQIEGGHGANISIEGLYTFSEELFDTDGQWHTIDWYGETGPDQYDVTVFLRLGGYSGESKGKAFFTNVQMEEVEVLPEDIVAARWFDLPQPAVYADEDEPPASPAWPLLLMICCVYILAACIVINSIYRHTAYSLSADYRISDRIVCLSLLFSFALRLIISFFIGGYQVDVNCFTSWGHTLSSVGFNRFYTSVSFCDYPPAYLPILGLNARITEVFSLSAGWTRVIFRFFPALCDLCACFILYQKYKKKTDISSLSFAAVIAFMSFNPMLILNSAAWGQMDSVLCLFILLVAMFAVEGKWVAALPVYLLAVLTKPQALILGPLGLIATFMAWRREKKARKGIYLGLSGCILLAAIILLLFTGEQNPNWIFKLYGNTLSSYPYVTVNTANLFYLLGFNWTKAAEAASLPAALILSLLIGLYAILWRKKAFRLPKWQIEFFISILFILGITGCAVAGLSWTYIGYGSMVFAFLIVLSLFVRYNDIRFLPYSGALLFILFYVFGLKMHERYLFPALFLLALSWILQRDYRILKLSLALSLCVFLNEGIILDNSIRLGASMGHLNQDTSGLAGCISLIHIFSALYAIRIAFSQVLEKENVSSGMLHFRDRSGPVSIGRTPLQYHPDRSLHWNKTDSVLLVLLTLSYGAISLFTLGSAKAPQTSWTSSSYDEQIIFDLGEKHPDASMLYFAQVSTYEFSVAFSADGSNWSDEIQAQTYQQCWKWKYLTDSYLDASGKRKYLDSGFENIIHISDRYVRLTSHQIGLRLNEILFKTDSGAVLPAHISKHLQYNADSELYSDPGCLLDEQNTLEGLPLLFTGSNGTDINQPSWWNSTYFDEIYHARTAYEFIHHSVPYETTHPPLGKILISWGIMLFGMTPFGWRFAGAVAGILMIPGMYLLGKQLTKKTSISALCGLLIFLDCQHLTQTQIATIDSFPVLFIIFAYFFMLRFIQSDLICTPRRKGLISLAASGFFMGLSIASKWIGIYAGLGLAVLFFWHCIRTIVLCNDAARQLQGGYLNKEEARRLQPYLPSTNSNTNPAIMLCLKYCAWCVLFFVLQPLVIYLLSYIPYFSYNQSIRHVFDYLNAVWQSQINMLNYHSTKSLGMDHPFYSPWWEWPVNGKPMYYASESYELGLGLFYSIFCFGNPAVWYTGLFCLIVCCAFWIYGKAYRIEGSRGSLHWFRKDYCNELSFILIGFLAQYLPWMLVPRGTYIYHYFASVPFIILSTGALLSILERKNKRIFIFLYSCLILLALAGFTVFFPYASGIMAPASWLEAGSHLLRIWY